MITLVVIASAILLALLCEVLHHRLLLANHRRPLEEEHRGGDVARRILDTGGLSELEIQVGDDCGYWPEHTIEERASAVDLGEKSDTLQLKLRAYSPPRFVLTEYHHSGTTVGSVAEAGLTAHQAVQTAKDPSPASAVLAWLRLLLPLGWIVLALVGLFFDWAFWGSVVVLSTMLVVNVYAIPRELRTRSSRMPHFEQWGLTLQRDREAVRRHFLWLDCRGVAPLIAPLAFVALVGLGAGGVLGSWDLHAARIGLVAIAVFAIVFPPLLERVMKRLLSISPVRARAETDSEAPA